MGDETKIEWVATRMPDGTVIPGHTFNPWIGCERVSPACDDCYAARGSARLAAGLRLKLWDEGSSRHVTSLAYWRRPFSWARKAVELGIHAKVFCASHGDVFEDREELEVVRNQLRTLIQNTLALDYLLLTKRPQNIPRMWPSQPSPMSNVWMGTTAEDQTWFDRRWEHLRVVPAVVHFVSCEPLLGQIKLPTSLLELGRRTWVITGGESGKRARPSHPEWFRSLRDQCAEAGVPFFFKQWGEWQNGSANGGEGEIVLSNGQHGLTPSAMGFNSRFRGDMVDWNNLSPTMMARVGKKVSGRLLDGVEHNGMPDGR